MKRVQVTVWALVFAVLALTASASCTKILGIDTDYGTNACEEDDGGSSQQTPCGLGACLVLQPVCTNGLPVPCTGGDTMFKVDEVCNDGIDNNCNGAIDEGCPCGKDGTTQGCYPAAQATRQVGLCQDGTQLCASTAWGTCSGAIVPVDEVCNGFDDNCNGVIDEGCPCTPGQMQPCFAGSADQLKHAPLAICKQGSQTCQSDHTWGDCLGQVLSLQHEICNGKDNNCNGIVPNANTPDDGTSCTCSVDSQCTSGQCVNGSCATCSDKIKDGNETDIDCGGTQCPACPDMSACKVAADCMSLVCTFGKCVTSTCTDHQLNGNETDVDCGGSTCPACTTGQKCNSLTDCDSHVCITTVIPHVCAAPTCSDGVKNGNETGVDCGGTLCGTCPNGQACSSGTDCKSSFCNTAMLCSSRPNGTTCSAGADCLNGNCVNNGTGTTICCASPCAAGYACVADGSMCNQTCTVDTQCTTGYYCVPTAGTTSGTCQPKLGTTRPCGSANECASGFCVDNGTGATICCLTACGNTYACDPTSGNCNTGCTTNGECAAKSYCSGNTCVGQKVLGQQCMAGTECNSGYCVDDGVGIDVCCSTASCANNLACNPANGQCYPAPCLSDADCTKNAYCGLTGSCLSRLTQGQVCTLPDQCLTGNCIASGVGTSVCCASVCGTNLACNPVGGVCYGGCTNDTFCVPGSYCSSGGTCVGQLVPGQPCSAADQCKTGQCVDNGVGNKICCSSPCGIYACAAAGTSCNTMCTNDTQCATGYYCNGASACVPKLGSGQSCTTYNQCSSGNCIDDGNSSKVCCQTTCGIYFACAPGTGICNSNPCTSDSSCVTGTFCTAPTCVGKVGLGAACSQANQCGSGNCMDDGNGTSTKICCAQACGNAYACAPGGGMCDVTCTVDSNCATGYYCGTGGACVLKQGPGTLCTAVDQCNSAGKYCLDDGNNARVCCQSLCQQNFACNPNGGQCNTLCNVDTDCVAGAYCSASKTCVSQEANGQSCTAVDQCLSGNCLDNGTLGKVCCAHTCGNNLACNATSGDCYPSCSADTNCIQGTYCSGTSCVAQKSNGQPCTGTDSKQCQSNNCVDDGNAGSTVCCAAQCSGNFACAAGTGACNVGPCTTDAQCASTAYCAVATGKCVQKLAAGSGCTAADQCSSGNCVDAGGGTQVCCSVASCGNYACGAGGACDGSCTTDAQCAGSDYCSLSAVCLAKQAQGASCTAVDQCSSGACVDTGNGTKICCQAACPSGYSCAAGGTCNATCTIDAQCILNDYCNAGVCGPKITNGQACNTASPTECQSGHCVDNGAGGKICCQTLCSTGYACGAAGTCDASPCSADTQCAGGFYCAAPSCVAQSAQGNSCSADDQCLTGHCVDNGMSSKICCATTCSNNLACNPGTGACWASCTADADCATGAYCSGTTCVGKGAAGAACTLNSQCAGNSCLGGFCCSGACADQGAGSCGTNATCASGTGACQKYPAGSACSSAVSCTGSTLTTDTKCDGAGNCNQGPTTPACPNNFACSVGTACYAACGAGALASDAKCALGYYCDGVGAGACQPKGGSGAMCGANNQCLGASCLGGYCCSGSCTDQGSTTCGTKGTCAAGTGACQKYPLGTTCSNPSCVNGTLTTDTQCDGNGNCSQGAMVQTCANNLACQSGTACYAGCGPATVADDAKCISSANYYCNGVGLGACIAKGGSGATCSAGTGDAGAGDECQSGICGSGSPSYCCMAPCSSADPTCGTTTCDNTGACSYPTLAMMTPCGTTACVNGTSSSTATVAGVCNGTGSCNGTSSSCGHFKCSGTTCSTSCTAGSQCWTGNCVDGGNGNAKVCCVASSCAPYACLQNGACGSQCASNADCSNSKTCTIPDGGTLGTCG